jgi:hypothetical protein
MQIRGDFLGFLKHFSGQSNIGEYRGNIPLELDEQCKLFFKAGQGAFCQFLGMNGAIFHKFDKSVRDTGCARTFW